MKSRKQLSWIVMGVTLSVAAPFAAAQIPAATGVEASASAASPAPTALAGADAMAIPDWPEGPRVFAVEPFEVMNGDVLTLFGDGFRPEPDDNTVDLITPDGRGLSLSILAVIDEDEDGNGEILQAVVQGLFATELGMPLSVVVRTGHGTSAILDPDEPAEEPVVLFTAHQGKHDRMEGALIATDGTERVAENDSAPVEGVDDLNGDGEEGDAGSRWCPELSWESNSTYKITGEVLIKFKYTSDDGKRKTAFVKLKLSGVIIKTGPAPSANECLEAIAAKLRATLELAEDDEAQLALENFEIVVEDGCIVVRKKSDGSDDIEPIAPTGKKSIGWQKS